ncbi:hypothetical protein [Colwellia sp. MB02u-14]|uniref:hypothetical protein n=1 Tax=Colwellia sp. MB02u-14 TaxID=2759815 RepID=UPI0015F412F9|nr:hypothetical protein [Colwellia sp. MB02u-14]MBA6302202.1 hypothetical protein [Colwellia sp. MB02u-14]
MPVDVTWSDSQIELVGKNQASQCLQMVTNMHNLGDSEKARVFALEALLVDFSIQARKEKYIDVNIALYACGKWRRKKAKYT